MTDRPQLWVFAGPNGAGKSTLVARFHVTDRIPVVNPDTIASRLEPAHEGEPAIMLRAGRMAASERRMLLASGQSFGIETTLTGHSELRLMADARSAGYKITLVFVDLDDALTALARVRERVARGGHDVPARIILRRYDKSLENLPVAVGLADRCFIVDNMRDRHRLLLTIDEGRIRHRSRSLPKWAARLISETLSRDGSDGPD
ncbi:MAG: AAA family ATPase [Rhodopila sp.]|nr:AAA family ATPase [Rhodopila sp.]